MPDGWQIGLFIHIAGVFALGGGIAVSVATYAMMRRAQTVQEIRAWSGLGRILSQYQVIPGTALVLVLSGAYLVSELNEEWSEGWIGFSALAVIVAVTAGLVLISPRMKSIGMAAGPAPDGPVPSAVAGKLNDPVLCGATCGNLMIAIAIIWNMTIQPGAAGALLSIVILAAIGVAPAIAGYARQKS